MKYLDWNNVNKYYQMKSIKINIKNKINIVLVLLIDIKNINKFFMMI